MTPILLSLAFAALVVALRVAIRRRSAEVRPRTVRDAIAECSNVVPLRTGPNRKKEQRHA